MTLSVRKLSRISHVLDYREAYRYPSLTSKFSFGEVERSDVRHEAFSAYDGVG